MSLSRSRISGVSEVLGSRLWAQGSRPGTTAGSEAGARQRRVTGAGWGIQGLGSSHGQLWLLLSNPG